MSFARILFLALGIVGGSVAAFTAAPASAADQGVFVRDRDRLTATIDAGDEDAFDFDLAEGGRLHFNVSAVHGVALRPSLRLFQPNGAEFDLASITTRADTPAPRVRTIVVPAGTTGRWQLRVTGAGGTTGGYRLSAHVSAPKVVRLRRLLVPAIGSVEVPFAGDTDALVKCSIRASKKTWSLPAHVRLLGPDGLEAPGSSGIFTTTHGVTSTRFVLGQGFGRYSFVLDPPPQGATNVEVLVSVRFAKTKSRHATLLPESRVDAVAPVEVRQEDSALTLTVQGTGLLAGSDASIGGDGVTVARFDVADDGLSATLVVDVAADAPYGKRRLVIFPPELLAESVAVADAVTVLAPNPTVASVSLGVGERGEEGLVLEATGTGFRAGGVIGVSGAGVTIGAAEIVSGTTARATIAIAVDAPVGQRDVTFTQPAAGGGASATLANAFDVTLAGPTFTSISPSTLQPSDSHVVLRIVGGNFSQGTTTSVSGAGVTVHSTTFVDSTTLDVDVSAASDAAPGRRNVTITPPPGAGPAHRFTDELTVVAPVPVVTSFSHVTLGQGAASVGVVVSGRNFRAGDTLVAGGSGVTFEGVAVAGTNQITATAAVAPAAATGLRALTVAHAASEGALSGTLTNAFRVVGAVPTFASVSPSSVGVTGPAFTRTVPLTISGTNFATGATVSVSRTGGIGLTVVSGSAVVVSDTRIDVVISLAGYATTGAWNVLVANPGGLGDSAASGDAALTVQPRTTLAVNRVIASSGGPYGGERVTIQGSGFADGCLVDFGAVRAVGTQVIDANTIVTTVPRPAAASNAAATSVAVKVTPTTGSAVTLTNGYAYATDDVRFRAVRLIPAQGATGVPQNLTSAVVVLSAPADTTTGSYGFTTGVNAFWYESTGSFVTTGFRGFGPGGRFLVFSRTGGGNLSTANGGQHVLDIPAALKSLGGNAFTPTRLSVTLNHDQQTFTLSAIATDATAPTLNSVAPANGSSGQDTTTKIVLTLSEELSPLTVDLSKITFTQGATTVPASLELSDDLKTVTITPSSELAANTTYTTTITGAVQDLFGNAFTPVTRTFTTGSGVDTTNPSIDSVAIESLPSSLDGSGAYVDAAGVAGRAFDVYLPRVGWRLDVTFSDAGGSGIDETTFSARCSVAVGANAANAELGSNFEVTSAGASWRVPSASPVTAAENVVFTFVVRDQAGNTSAASVITVDVADKDATAALGGDLDPIDSRRTWILRADVDAFTATFVSRTSPSTQQGAATSVAANGLTDLEETLRFVGLGTANMTSAAAATTNGPDSGTNAIVRRMFLVRLRELLNERFSIAADGTHDADSVDVEFLLPGEQGSLAGAPTYSTANTSNSSKAFSEISIGATLGAESGAYATSSKIGDAWYDARNLHEEADLNLGGASDTGVFLLDAFKLQVNSNALFMAKISSGLVAVHGGTPVGEDAGDDDVLAGGFDRTSSSDAVLNARYDAIMDAVEYAALYASAITAHEIGHSLGLVPDGAPKTGLFGAAHFNNAFTEATSATPNTPHHLDFLGNDIMAASSSFDATTLTGSDFKRFSPMDIAFLRNRLLHDEGK